ASHKSLWAERRFRACGRTQECSHHPRTFVPPKNVRTTQERSYHLRTFALPKNVRTTQECSHRPRTFAPLKNVRTTQERSHYPRMFVLPWKSGPSGPRKPPATNAGFSPGVSRQSCAIVASDPHHRGTQ